jgi:hypothetical protein
VAEGNHAFAEGFTLDCNADGSRRVYGAKMQSCDGQSLPLKGSGIGLALSACENFLNHGHVNPKLGQ